MGAGHKVWGWAHAHSSRCHLSTKQPLQQGGLWSVVRTRWTEARIKSEATDPSTSQHGMTLLVSPSDTHISLLKPNPWSSISFFLSGGWVCFLIHTKAFFIPFHTDLPCYGNQVWGCCSMQSLQHRQKGSDVTHHLMLVAACHFHWCEILCLFL